MRFRLSEVASAVDGTLLGEDVEIRGACIDSRTVEPGALFVPVMAERDGHDFIDDAMRNGAAAHLTQRETGRYPAVRVKHTLPALQQLGRAARDRMVGEVVGITGSVGKTTAKDLLAAVLEPNCVTHASYRSFNNELGVPITLVDAPDDVDVVVVEMGARGQGHIAELCEIARPTIGIVLAVGAAHTELFGDLDGVARAKAELVEALGATNTAILNAGDRRVRAMARHTSAEVVLFGDGGDVRAEDVRLDDSLRPSFRLESPWGSAPCSLSSAGVHNVTNALAAAAAALVLGVAVADVANALGGATLSPWRMDVVRHHSGAVIINDAYNANTLSMYAAIDALERVPATRRIAVVGVMAELGSRHQEDHQAVGDRLARLGVDVVSVGVPEYGGILVADIAEAAAAVGALSASDAVLVKASRVAGLERLVELL